MTAKNRTDLKTDIDNAFPTNGIQGISATDLRTYLKTAVDSSGNEVEEVQLQVGSLSGVAGQTLIVNGTEDGVDFESQVVTIQAGTGITVDSADPNSPIVAKALSSRMLAFVENSGSTTTIASSGYKDINVTLADAGFSNEFTIISNNQVRYDGTPTKQFVCTLNFSGEKSGGGGGQECNFSLFKNGSTQLSGKQSQIILSGQRSNVNTHQVVELATNDYVIAKVENITGNNNIANEDCSVSIEEI